MKKYTADKLEQVMKQRQIAVAVTSMCLVGGVSAAPVAPEVVHGSASFIRQGGHLEISNSNGTIINWQDFSIAQQESVHFLQTHASSAILNRVVSNIPSNILGDLTSNGRVFVINPNGLVIGKDATIDTAGFVASTLDINDQDFVAGRMKFVGDSGEIENHGYIAAGPGGEVILIAPNIENHGIIEAPDGQILLAAGREVTLHSIQNGGISYRVSAPGDKALNIGQLVSSNGSVKVFADQVFQQGDISATRARRGADGSIVLEADSNLSISGNIDASGEGVAGGEIHLLGAEVDVANASINASGEGGGEILIGGDYQGNGTVKNAQNTDVDAATVIRADGGTNGDGGRVIVWSDNTTNSFGKITARGGSQSGDGGFVETSGKKVLDWGQAADVSATNGKAGTWLLDPEDIVIDETKADSIETALNSGSNVEVKTSDEGDGEGNITVDAPITKTEGDDAVTLTLDAHNRVDVNAPITTTAGPLNVDIKTGRQVAAVDTTEEAPTADDDELVANEAEGTESETSDQSEASETTEVADQTGSDEATESEEVVTEQAASEEGETAEEVAETSANEPEGEQSAETADVVADSAPEAEEVDAPTDSTDVETNVETVAEAPEQSADQVEQPETVEEVVEETQQDIVTAAAPSSDDTPVVDAAVEAPESQASGLIDQAEQQIVIAADIFTGGGDVAIDAGEDGDAIIIADVDTTDHDGDVAGDITVEAENIAILDDAEVDASDEVAGEIQIGGGQQGQDPEIDNADIVLIGKDATVSADGGEEGDGGRVIVFSEQTSIISGNLSARGGTRAGNGGFIETSALLNLRVDTTPNVSAPNGQGGTWLIDPLDITIDALGGSTNTDTSVVGAPPSTYSFTPTAMTTGARIDVGLIGQALENDNNVIIDTTGTVGAEYGDINWMADLTTSGFDGAFSGSLTLNAARDINFDGNIK